MPVGDTYRMAEEFNHRQPLIWRGGRAVDAGIPGSGTCRGLQQHQQTQAEVKRFSCCHGHPVRVDSQRIQDAVHRIIRFPDGERIPFAHQFQA